MSEEYYKIVRATDLGGLRVHLVFSDGVERTVDVGEFLRKHPHGQHNKYLDPAEFAKFKIVNGNIEWGRDADLIFPIDELHDGVDLSDGENPDRDELLTQLYGPNGTPARDKIEAEADTQRKANALGQKLVLLRVEQGLTKKDLADAAAVGVGTVSKAENGRSIPLTDLFKIIHILAPGTVLDMGRLGRIAL